MNSDEQKRIFAKNLNRYISISGKQQNEIAKDMNINPPTLNMWTKGNSMPNTGKIRALADYFKIGITDLTDDKDKASEKNLNYSSASAQIGFYDERFQDIVIAYSNLSIEEKDLFCSFCEKFIFKKQKE